MLQRWTKKLDEMHFYKSDDEVGGMSRTLCGKPMLGNNYADQFPLRAHCIKCMKKMTGNKTWTCPKCGKVTADFPAISRKDNRTKICSACGTAEALSGFVTSLDVAKETGGWN